MKTLQILVLVAILASLWGCTSTPFMGDRMSVVINTNVTESQRIVARKLRNGGYLVSSEPTNVVVDLPEYEGRSHGLFGLGGKWQEKVVLQIQFDPGPDTTRLLIDPKIYERQNSRFEWIEINESEKAGELVRPVLYRLQTLGY